MKRIALVLSLLSLALPVAADSASDAGMAEVRELGMLNGQALACSHTQAAARIKTIMIKLAPKSRRYGEAFEAATSETFLAQIKSPADCKDEPTINSKTEEVAARLLTAVPIADPQ
ncbi:MAG: hypothetical protein K8H84_10415 [Sulfuricella denitrificans]|nr:hypothetical protein [Sulfuricella denitrificans]